MRRFDFHRQTNYIFLYISLHKILSHNLFTFLLYARGTSEKNDFNSDCLRFPDAFARFPARLEYIMLMRKMHLLTYIFTLNDRIWLGSSLYIYCIIDIFLSQTYVKLFADVMRQDRDQWKIYANKRMKATYKFSNAEQNVYMYTSSCSMLANDVGIKSYDGYMTRYLHASWRDSFNRSHPLIALSIDRWKHTLTLLYKMSFYKILLVFKIFLDKC